MKYLVLILLLISTPCYALNLTQSCLAFYKLDDNAATTDVRDERGQNPATSASNSSVTFAGGKILGAKDFDGFVNRIDCGSDFIGQRSFTICMWIYPESFGENNQGRLISNGKVTWRINTVNDRMNFSSDGLVTTVNSATNSIVLNTWQLICVTRTSTGVANLYVNGVLSGNADQNSGTPAEGTTNIFIGNQQTQVRTFDGPIDNVMIFERILTLNEIIKLFNAGRGLGSLSTLEMENGLE